MQGNSRAVKVSEMLSLGSAVINPRPDLGNRVVSREPGGIFPSITFYYIPSKVTQASTEPRESQIAPLHSKHGNFQQVSWGHPAQSYFLPPSLMLSLRALQCCSCLSLPAHTIPNLGSFLHPPLPVPKSLFDDLFPSPRLFSAPCTKDTPSREAVTLHTAALSEQVYLCAIKGRGKTQQIHFLKAFIHPTCSQSILGRNLDCCD